jgi:outer membrane protein TolC
LDLLNSVDTVDDGRRGVVVAKNRILPDLDASGSATMSTDPDRKNSLSYNTERTTWRAALELRIDDRKTERNAYRASLVGLRRAERRHEESADSVRADVRRALRRIDEKSDSRMIRVLDVEENMLRLNAARAQFDLGLADNQDVIDAENDLLGARNALAGAVADYRVAILQFWLDTGLFRVTDDGEWEAFTLLLGRDPAAPTPEAGP